MSVSLKGAYIIIEKEAQTQRNKNTFRICTKSSILWSQRRKLTLNWKRVKNLKVINNYYYFSFWPHHAACGLLVPWPGIEPMLPAVEAWSRIHWTTREVSELSLVYSIHHPDWCTRPISSVQFSRSVVSNSFRLHELQHARPPCPSPTPGVHSNSCPLSRWYHPAISSFVVPFSSCPQLHQSLFQWVNFSREVAKVLEFQLQPQSFQRTPRADFL